MENKLIIIGNGFDLHHGIRSRYSEFATYLERVDQRTFDIVVDYVVPDKDLWSALEERLADVDVDQIEDYAQNYLSSYGEEDWSEHGHHAYGYEIKQICDAISEKLRKHFADWIRQLELPANLKAPVKCIDQRALFLNFNYTNTLQALYGVPIDRVLHIHGSVLDSTSDIVLGHGFEQQAGDLRSRLTDEDTDVRVAGGFELIDSLFAETFKPTKDIIARNESFFRKLDTVTEIYVLGHSLAQVDEPYFSEVLKRVPGSATWTVSYYSDDVAAWFAADEIGIPTARLRLRTLNLL